MPGKLTAQYRLDLPGVQLLGEMGKFASSALPSGSELTVAQDSGGGPITVRIEIPTDDPDDGIRLAARFVNALSQRLTLELAGTLTGPINVDAPTQVFQPEQLPNTLQIALVEPIRMKWSFGVNAVALWSPVRLQTTLTALDLEASTPPLPELAIARRVFAEGVGTSHPLSRYLTVYTAAGLFLLYKGKRPTQDEVDPLLLSFDATIPVQSKPAAVLARNPKVRTETIYTAARNGFVHAEEKDRGQDPVAALDEIQRLLPKFQEIVGRILLAG